MTADNPGLTDADLSEIETRLAAVKGLYVLAELLMEDVPALIQQVRYYQQTPARVLGRPPDHARLVDNEWRRKTMGAYGVADDPDLPPVGASGNAR